MNINGQEKYGYEYCKDCEMIKTENSQADGYYKICDNIKQGVTCNNGYLKLPATCGHGAKEPHYTNWCYSNSKLGDSYGYFLSDGSFARWITCRNCNGRGYLRHESEQFWKHIYDNNGNYTGRDTLAYRCKHCGQEDVDYSEYCTWHTCEYVEEKTGNSCRGKGGWKVAANCEHHQSAPHSYCRHNERRCETCSGWEDSIAHEHIGPHKDDIQ